MLFGLGIKNFYESLFVKALQQVPGSTMEAIISSGMMNRLSIYTYEVGLFGLFRYRNIFFVLFALKLTEIFLVKKRVFL